MSSLPPSPSPEEILQLSARHIAGGVVSLNRKVQPHLVFVRAQGSKLYDATGREYLDYHAAFAPHLLGHNHPEISRAVRDCLDRGWSLVGSGTTPWEAELAHRLCTCVPNLDLVQLLNTGSEATALAIRLARAATGRDDVLTPLGGYNGWHDEVGRAVMPSLADIGPRRDGQEYPFIPISAGIPESTQRRIHVINFNDLAAAEHVLKTERIACLITEPVLQNIGVVLPEPGYLQGLRDLCTKYGTVLIFDEVKTGFRSALAGYQSLCGVRPDLTVFGKAVANGYPLGVLGGKRDLMQLFDAPDPKKRVLVAGTYNGHPVTAAAAIATLDLLARDNGQVYQDIESMTVRLQSGIESAFAKAGRPALISRNASAFCAYFMDHRPRDWHDILEHHDFDLDRRLRAALIDRGIYQFPLPAKQSSLSSAHSAADLDRTLSALSSALATL